MLVEVKRELVKQDHRFLQKRFLQDAHNRLTVYIWQLPDDDDGEMLRFQVSYKEIAVDWAAERGIRFASVDDGENPMGMKRSPILTQERSLKHAMLERLVAQLDSYSDKKSLRFVRDTIDRDALNAGGTNI
ncbi:MAG: hypothetical protein J0L53_09710 [Spirochaetes bacterium]|nr:hypothetical protein [Spirochaetota bacterium]MBX3721427.1 hypothetical protein [Turneriella sp.]